MHEIALTSADSSLPEEPIRKSLINIDETDYVLRKNKSRDA
jgi:hypothetical protein